MEGITVMQTMRSLLGSVSSTELIVDRRE
jgi:hypothetical protein